MLYAPKLSTCSNQIRPMPSISVVIYNSGKFRMDGLPSIDTVIGVRGSCLGCIRRSHSQLVAPIARGPLSTAIPQMSTGGLRTGNPCPSLATRPGCCRASLSNNAHIDLGRMFEIVNFCPAESPLAPG